MKNLISLPRLSVFLLAFVASLAFSVLAFPGFTRATDYHLAEDGYDRLAQGICLQGSFSYYPNPFPTVLRGPAYPALVAVILSLGDDWYPRSVQIAQAVLHGFTCMLAFGLGSMLFDGKRGFIAGVVCAIHPYLIWYSSRLVTETLATFLFTAIMFNVVYLARNPKPRALLLLSVSLAAASLCKGTFLPLVLLVPLVLILILPSTHRWKIACGVFATAVMIISPWSLRNYTLTRQVIPVHSLLGYNLRMGDVQAEFYERSPFSYARLMDLRSFDISSRGDTISHWWMRNVETMTALEADNELIARSFARYLHEPLLVIRKLVFGPIMFWTLSSTTSASLFASLLQVPLLILFVVSTRRILKRYGNRSLWSALVCLVVAYFVLHVPVMALARFSVVLIPTMIVYVVSIVPELKLRTLSNTPTQSTDEV